VGFVHYPREQSYRIGELICHVCDEGFWHVESYRRIMSVWFDGPALLPGVFEDLVVLEYEVSWAGLQCRLDALLLGGGVCNAEPFVGFA